MKLRGGMSVNLTLQLPLAIITLDNPPVNSLGLATRTRLQGVLLQALNDSNINAIILTGSETVFSGGADIKEFNTENARTEPTLATLIHTIETTDKPIIAAINGVCMGGGFELAMACHYRVAHAKTSVALPEVKLGLLPGAGGTQRLPRLIGIQDALSMIMTGKTHLAEELQQTKLFDHITDHPVLQAAMIFAEKVANIRPLPRSSELTINASDSDTIFTTARNTLLQTNHRFPAPLACIDAVEAATKRTFFEGLQVEREIFLKLMESNASKALRHIFFAEREASKIAGLAQDINLRAINQVAVIGAGTMGTGIAMVFANAGIPVVLLELQEAAAQRGLQKIQAHYSSAAKKNKISDKEAELRSNLIRGTSQFDDIKNADLVIEAVFEEMSVKESVFKKLDEVMKDGAILASNTSTLDLHCIAEFTKRPEDVIGLHFFSPANVMPLLEIVRTKKTADVVLATCMKLAKKLKKTAVVAGVCDGFIGNRMLEQYTKQAAFLLEEGCTPYQVDHAMEQFGFAMGPFRMSDLAGNDVSWSIRKRRRLANPQTEYSFLGDLLCEQGRFGQKTNAGWYDYQANDRTAYPSSTVQQMIKQHAQEIGAPQRSISDEEIVQRLVFALTNEGLKILDDGIAARASDIDLVYIKGYGFPLHHGGPLFYAKTIGWGNVKNALEQFALAYRGHTWHIAKNIANQAI